MPDAPSGSPLKTPGSLLRSTGVVSLATFASRITGLIRDALISNYFLPKYSDAFIAASRVPNLLRFLFAEGAFSAAFIPTFIRVHRQQGREEADRLACSLGRVLFLATGALSLVGILLARPIVYFLLPGRVHDPAVLELCVTLTRIMFPFLIFIALAGLAMGQLNSLNRLGIPAVSPVLFNTSNIIFLAALHGYFATQMGLAKGLAVALVIGGALQWMFQLPSLWRLGMLRHLWGGLWHPETRRVTGLMGPMVVGLAGNQLAFLINQQLASFLPDGSISILYYANRLFQFPLGVLGIALTTAAFPRLANQAGDQDHAAFAAELNHSIRLLFFVMIPATLGLVVLAAPSIYAVYQHGKFAQDHLFDATVAALALYSIGLTGHSGVKVLSTAFYSFHNTRTPVKITLQCLGLNVVCSVVFCFWWKMGTSGLALATTVAALVNAAMHAIHLRRAIGSAWHAGLRGAFARTTLASVVMAYLVWISLKFLPLPVDSKWHAILHLAVGLTIGVGSYAGLAWLLAREEMRHFLRDLARR